MPLEQSHGAVMTVLAAVRRRRITLDVMAALSIGAAMFAVVQWLTIWSLPAVAASIVSIGASVTVGGMLLSRWRKRWTLAAVAQRIESVRPQSRNVLITAEELHRHPGRASVWMTGVVMDRAAHAIAGLRPPDAAAARFALVALAIASAAGIALLFAPRADTVAGKVGEVARSAAKRIGNAGQGSVVVAVHPPEYTRIAAKTFADPERLDVLEGTRLTFSVTGPQSHRLRFGDKGVGELGARGSVEYTPRDSGYFVIEPSDGAADLSAGALAKVEAGPYGLVKQGERRLIILTVTPDRAPAVRVEQPARDLLLPNAFRTVPVAIVASDDLALASFELRYTKMAGSGEQFEFTEGRVPLTIERHSDREWRARGDIALQRLQLAAGDSIVYRAVATDRRPGGGGIGASDTFFIEIAGPGHVPLDAVGMPPNEERYALSQQMIVLKIERLRSRQQSLLPDDVIEEAALIAAEQRSVRANFIFLLGGHVEDEEVEAEQSSEIAEGRLLNTARRDINQAIRDMTRAEQGLTATDTIAALTSAKAAVTALQRAFGRSRYLLRTLPARGRIDLSRRLTGKLDGASSWERTPEAPETQHAIAARSVLREILELSNTVAAKSLADAGTVDRLAERALAVDPAASTWQEVSRRLLTIRGRLHDADQASAMLEQTVTIVRKEVDRYALPRTLLSAPASPLTRAWEGRARR